MSRRIQPIPAALLLADGTYWKGYSIGKIGITAGEICFNTGMTGYQEVFSDPSYHRQILVETHVHVGNYGMREEEMESNAIRIAGLVCRNYNVSYARTLATQSIQDVLSSAGLVGIGGLDTRKLVTHIRAKGAMNAVISSENISEEFLSDYLKQVPSMLGLELSSEVTTRELRMVGDPSSKFRVALLDLGVKENIIRCLTDRGAFVGVFPAHASFSEIMAFEPSGFQISNGPGDPSAMPYAVDLVKKMLDTRLPLFGICLGHQILAEATGIGTYKMFNGHRGCNHPVLNKITGRAEMTSQNHGFSIIREDAESHPEILVTHVNLNDQSVEGIKIKNLPAFSVQYHPESNPGPHDSRYLFDQFLELMANPA